MCVCTGGTSPAQWEDITGTTPLTFSNDCVSFTTNVSARYGSRPCQLHLRSAFPWPAPAWGVVFWLSGSLSGGWWSGDGPDAAVSLPISVPHTHKALAWLEQRLLAGTQTLPLKAAMPHRALVFSVNGNRESSKCSSH